MNIQEFKNLPNQSSSDQKYISDLFIKLTNEIPELKEFRDLVEREVWGFGEREFAYMHKMIIDSIGKKDIKALEIGVYKGQIISLWKIIEKLSNKNIDVYGVTPLDSTDGHIESDYLKDIHDLHDLFHLEYPTIIKGLSQFEDIIDMAKKASPFDVLYVDGHHGYEMVKSDLINYTPMVYIGGFVVVDDSANDVSGAYSGRFWGIDPVTRATVEFFKDNNDFEYYGNVIHNKIFRRVK